MVANPKKDRALGPAMVAEASPHSAGGEIPVAERAGWKAYQAEKREAATMILLHRGKRYAPLYPDGSFDPAVEVKRKVRIDWQRAEQRDAINCKFHLPPARPALR